MSELITSPGVDEMANRREIFTSLLRTDLNLGDITKSISHTVKIWHHSQLQRACDYTTLSDLKPQIDQLIKESLSSSEVIEFASIILKQIGSLLATCILFGDFLDDDGKVLSSPRTISKDSEIISIEELLRSVNKGLIELLTTLITINDSALKNLPREREKFDQWSLSSHLDVVIRELSNLAAFGQMSSLIPILSRTTNIEPPQTGITGLEDRHWYSSLVYLQTKYIGQANTLLVRQMATAFTSIFGSYGEVSRLYSSGNSRVTHLSLRFSHEFQAQLFLLPPQAQTAIEEAFTTQTNFEVNHSHPSFSIPLLIVENANDHSVYGHGTDYDDEISILYRQNPEWRAYLKSLLQTKTNYDEILSELALVAYGDEMRFMSFQRFLPLDTEATSIQFRYLQGFRLTQYVQKELFDPFLRLNALLSDPNFRDQFKKYLEQKKAIDKELALEAKRQKAEAFKPLREFGREKFANPNA